MSEGDGNQFEPVIRSHHDGWVMTLSEFAEIENSETTTVMESLATVGIEPYLSACFNRFPADHRFTPAELIDALGVETYHNIVISQWMDRKKEEGAVDEYGKVAAKVPASAPFLHP